MGRHNFRPLRVYQAAKQLAETLQGSRLPDWHAVTGIVPTSQVLIRPQMPQHPVSRLRLRTVTNASGETKVGPVDLGPYHNVRRRVPKNKKRKPSKLFQPVKIEYEEDSLRRTFFKDHPWELARPRMVLENDGKDREKEDWSHLEQQTRQVDGESVVQRQLYLLHTVPDITELQAYDIARREFYKYRHQQAITQKIAREEALYVGGYFGRSALDVGMQLEDKQFEEWKVWAAKRVEEQEARTAAMYTDTEPVELDTKNVETLAEDTLETDVEKSLEILEDVNDVGEGGEQGGKQE